MAAERVCNKNVYSVRHKTTGALDDQAGYILDIPGVATLANTSFTDCCEGKGACVPGP